MPGLVPGTHVLVSAKDVDGRDKPGQDDVEPQFRRTIACGGVEKFTACTVRDARVPRAPHHEGLTFRREGLILRSPPQGGRLEGWPQKDCALSF